MTTNNENRTFRVHIGAALLALAVAVLAGARTSAAQQPTPLPIPGFSRCDVDLLGAAPSAIAAADLNRDGNPDLAVVDTANNRVIILVTNRDGLALGDCASALTRTDVAVGTDPVAIVAGDADGNGAVDLAVASQAGISIIRRDASGNFTAAAPIAANSDPQAVAIADVDGDGRPDIVVGNGNGNSVTILYGRAGGGFDKADPLSVGGPVTFMVVQDLNRDSLTDIAAGSKLTGDVTVFLRDPSVARAFRVLSAFSVGVAPTAMVASDFNRDGTPDLAVASGGVSGVVSIFRNQLPANESVPFVMSAVQTAGTSPSSLGVSDFNRDFEPDLAVANQGANTVAFFVGNGQGGINPASGNCAMPGDGGSCQVGLQPRALAVADVDGDGRSDVITANQGNLGSVSLLLSTKPQPTPTGTPAASVPPTRTPSTTPTLSPFPSTTPSPVATPTPISDCCRTHTGAGCQVKACQDQVCQRDTQGFCCSQGWDQDCVDLARAPEQAAVCMCPPLTFTPTITATATATGSATPTPPATFTPTSTLTPIATATNTGPTPFSTRTPTPTQTITGSPLPTSTSTPTPTPGGDCCAAHNGPACGSSSADPCSTCVCGLLPSCCNDQWSARCAGLAQGMETSVCVAVCQCGTPTATPSVTPTPTDTPPINDCCRAHFPTPGCQDPPTCATPVCGLDPFCCSGGWDQGCVDLAMQQAAACMCPTQLPTPTPTATPVATASATGTQTSTATSTITQTQTGSPPPPTRTPTPTQTTTGSVPPTLIPTTTPTITPTLTPAPTFTRTPQPQTPGPTQLLPGVSLQGQSCAITGNGRGDARDGFWLLPALILWIRRRRR